MIKRSGVQELSLAADARHARGAVRRLRAQLWRKSMMTKIALAVALTIAALSAIPAFAAPNHGTQVACTEDLGYGRTGTYGS